MPKHINNRFDWIEIKPSKLEKKTKLGGVKEILKSVQWTNNYEQKLPIPKDRFK
jgi:hypothetical protein